MDRRDFIKSVGVVGMFSLLGVIPLHGSASTGRKDSSAAARHRNSNPHLEGPFDLAFDRSGNLLVTDPPAYRVARLDSKYHLTSSFGAPGSRAGKLNFPKGIAVDPTGRICVVDSNNCRVQIFDPEGNVERVIGSVGAMGGSFSTPQGIWAGSATRMLVADTRNHRIQIYRNGSLHAILGRLGDADDEFRLPTACAVKSDGEIFVLDSKHGLVKIFGPDLAFKRAYGGVGSGPGRLNMPQGMELESNGHVWVADTGNHRVQEFGPDGKPVSVLGKEGSGPGELQSPTSVRCRDGKIYVVDNGNRRIQIFSRAAV